MIKIFLSKIYGGYVSKEEITNAELTLMDLYRDEIKKEIQYCLANLLKEVESNTDQFMNIATNSMLNACLDILLDAYSEEMVIQFLENILYDLKNNPSQH